MSQKFTLHTHTNQFDGKNTVAEMVATAQKHGMTAIGISNHFIVHPDIKKAHFYTYAVRGGYQNNYHDDFDVAINEFRKNYDELERVAQNSKISVLRGAEVDFFPDRNWYQNFERMVNLLKPDYLIGACHFVEYNGGVCNVHDMARADTDTRTHMLNAYWRNIRAASDSGLFTWLAHLDLPRKVGIGTGEEWQICEHDTISTLAKNKTPIEINTGLHPMPYPSHRILHMVAHANLPVLISDDAHHVEQIGRHFDNAERLCDEFGIKNRLSLHKILDFSNKTL